MHYDSVMIPMLKKIAELEAYINGGQDLAAKRSAQMELNKVLMRKAEIENMNKNNLAQL